jgi:hypothetical protein
LILDKDNGFGELSQDKILLSNKKHTPMLTQRFFNWCEGFRICIRVRIIARRNLEKLENENVSMALVISVLFIAVILILVQFLLLCLLLLFLPFVCIEFVFMVLIKIFIVLYVIFLIEFKIIDHNHESIQKSLRVFRFLMKN